MLCDSINSFNLQNNFDIFSISQATFSPDKKTEKKIVCFLRIAEPFKQFLKL